MTLSKITRVLLAPYMLFFLTSCTQQATPPDITSTSLDLKEIHKGILQGYLEQSELPNSLKLLPAPPAEGSTAWQLDQQTAAYYVALNDEERLQQATRDADLSFPSALLAFNVILPVEINEEDTPNAYLLIRRTLADAGLSTYAAKNHYNRTRPFVVNSTPMCTPEDEETLRNDGSYPSGHTAIGWAWALILTELFPDQADIILARGKEFGISRNVCNVHWHSDVQAGRIMGAATVARLHANDQFEIDLNASKQEIRALRQRNE